MSKWNIRSLFVQGVRIFMKKYLLRYGVLLLVMLLALPLVGCGDDAAELKEGYLKSLEIESSRSRSELTVTYNQPMEELNQEMQLLFAILREGLAMEATMESLTSMKIDMEGYGGDLLREAGYWPSEEGMQAELFLQNGKMAFKTAADSAYLLLDPADAVLLAPEDAPGMQLQVEPYTEQQIELMMGFLVPFLEEFDFRFSNVEDLGTVELELPEGTIEAKGIRLHLDNKEFLDLVAYTCRQLAESEHMKGYFETTMQMQLEMMEEQGLVPEDELPTEEEKEEMLEMVLQGLNSMLLQVAEMAESPNVLQQQFGLDISATADYYLDEDGYIRKSAEKYSIRVEHEELAVILGTPVLDIDIETESIVWDINQPLEVAFPVPTEMVSFFALMENPDLAANLGDGPLYHMFQFLYEIAPPLDEVGYPLILDLEQGLYTMNEEPVEMDVAPYLDEGVLMLPLRQMAELGGAEVSWDPEAWQVHFRDDEMEMIITIGSNLLQVNGEEMALERAATIVDGRTMVPAQVVELFTQYFVLRENTAVILF